VLDEALHAIEYFLYYTWQGEFLRTSRWAWPVFESLHFLGMSVLIGTIGMFDLRLLGFARAVPLAALHRMIPVGIAAFALNAITGLCFLSATPDQYLFNKAFRWKVVFFLIAGLNVVFFYARQFRRLEARGATGAPPLGARIAGGVSLGAWIGVMAAGRLLTFFRP
jgi:hypothetical protein